MASIRTAPCNWTIAGCDEGAGLDCSSLVSLPPETKALVEESAVAYLWNWTGKKYGLCELTLRPCREDCFEGQTTYRGYAGNPDPFLPRSGAGGVPWTPALIGGEWFNLRCGACGDLCSCDRVSSIDLPGPVDSIVEVVIDGQTLSTSAYRVDNRRLLVRQDGEEWPRCQDLRKPPGEEGTWEVTYLRGAPVPAQGRLAAGVLACEMAKAICGDKNCKLPQRVQTISREGVSMTLLDSFEGLEKGATGLWVVDSWVRAENNAPRRPTVYSPDRAGTRATTWRV